MKHIFILLTLLLILQSCSKDQTFEAENVIIESESNRMLMLKVDYQTYTFDGGTELFFDSNLTQDSIPMEVNFVQPGDFGGITLTHIPTNETIFDGTIIWAGLGERIYPVELQPATFFTLTETASLEPAFETVQLVNPIPNADPSQLAGINYPSIWSAISELDPVQYYMEHGAFISILIYTPSVGTGDPADWDYYVMLYL